MKPFLRLPLLMLPLVVVACSTAPTPTLEVIPPVTATSSPADAAFANAVAQDGAFALQSSQIAAGKAGRAGIRTFAQSVVDTQTQANAKLAEIARANGMALSQSPTPAQAKTIERLTSTPDGATFRRIYVSELVKSQIASRNRMEAYVANGTNPALKAFASDQIPAMRDQVKAARQLPRTRA